MKIAIVTDAWMPQVNGVVKTLEHTIACLRAQGHVVEVIEPSSFRSIPCPTYPEIRLALLPYRKLAQRLQAFNPDAVHIATEGPLGFAARRYACRYKLNFTTAYHTKFPEYVQARTGIPATWLYPIMRYFHRPARAVMVATESVRAELSARGFRRLVTWSRGVDMALFDGEKRTTNKNTSAHAPIFIYVGRIAVEKNIEAFLELPLPGCKWLVGDGPALQDLQKRYPEAVFHGVKSHQELALIYRQADVFVFPSKTDTFGLVLLEALASGLTVAAYPVAGPMDVLAGCGAGAMRHDLLEACLTALELDSTLGIAHARRFSWENTTRQFANNLCPNRPDSRPSVSCAAASFGER
jgi:glycosyltransferase involved in cell wall biosynthesis